MTTKRYGVGCLVAGGLAATGVLYVLGRLKSFYYYSAFGIDPGSLEIGFWDHLFESWFTVQNLLFLVLLWWIWTLALHLERAPMRRLKCALNGWIAR